MLLEDKLNFMDLEWNIKCAAMISRYIGSNSIFVWFPVFDIFWFRSIALTLTSYASLKHPYDSAFFLLCPGRFSDVLESSLGSWCFAWQHRTISEGAP